MRVGPIPQAAPDGSAALRFLARELDDLARRAARLEHALGATLDAGTRPSAATMIMLQDLDLIRQSLEDLHRLGAALADSPARAGNAPVADLAGLLRLTDLRHRLLTGAPPEDRDGDDDDSDGLVAFFHTGRT